MFTESANAPSPSSSRPVVDSWILTAARVSETDSMDRNESPSSEDRDAALAAICSNTAFSPSRRISLRMKDEEAVMCVAEESLDFILLSTAYLRRAVAGDVETLDRWFEKVRVGGILVGQYLEPPGDAGHAASHRVHEWARRLGMRMHTDEEFFWWFVKQ